MTQPKISRLFIISPKSRAEAKTAKTDSVLSSSDATVASVCLCPKTCSVYARPQLNTPEYKSDGKAVMIELSLGVSNISIKMQDIKPETANCIIESLIPQTSGAYFSINII